MKDFDIVVVGGGPSGATAAHEAAPKGLSGLLLEGLQRLAGEPGRELSLVARWLMAWGDAFLTGMFGAIFVAFVPQRLATWSHHRYLTPPPKP